MDNKLCDNEFPNEAPGNTLQNVMDRNQTWEHENEKSVKKMFLPFIQKYSMLYRRHFS
jgi:hypothetical protein